MNNNNQSEHNNNNNINKIFSCLDNDDISCLKQFIEDGFLVDTLNENNNTLLHIAVQYSNLELINYLLLQKPNLNIVDKRKNTVLHLASKRGDDLIVKTLIEAGAFINPQNEDGDTPLMIACNENYLLILKDLLNANADITISSIAGVSPFILAVESNNYHTVNLLLNTNLITQLQKNQALLVASHYSYDNLINLLLKHDADINYTNELKESSLHLACVRFIQAKSTVKILLNNGIDVNLSNINNETALDYSIKFKHSNIIDILNSFINYHSLLSSSILPTHPSSKKLKL